jgi:hypothetical protein
MPQNHRAILKNAVIRRSAFLPIAALILMGCGAALAVTGPTTVFIAGKGDIVGTNPATQLSIAGPPAVDAAGDVAFRTVRTIVNNNGATDTCILLYSGTNITTVVATKDPSNPAPGTNGAIFNAISDPVLSGSGALAFIGGLQVGAYGASGVTASDDSGIWVYDSGTTSLVHRTGDIPDTGSNFPVPVAYSSFNQVAVDDTGTITFLAGLQGHGVSTAGLFHDAQLLVVKGPGGGQMAPSYSAFVPLPYVSGQSRTLDTVNGNIAVYGQLNLPFSRTIALAQPPDFQLTDTLETGDAAADLFGVTIKSFGEPAVNASGEIAFLMGLEGSGIKPANNSAIEVYSGTQGTLIAQTGGFAPDETGTLTRDVFDILTNPVLNNNGAVAFVGKLRPGQSNVRRRQGVWSNAGGTLKQVALEGQPAPGGGKFSYFKQIVLPDHGDVILLANLVDVPRKDDRGIWAMEDNGSLVKVVRTGDLLEFHGVEKEVKSLAVFLYAAHETGQSRSFDASTANLVYQATFTDGNWGIYEVTFP